MLGAFVLMQDGVPEDGPRPHGCRPQCRQPEGGDIFSGRRRRWPVALPGLDLVFSHDAAGEPMLTPPHDQAISMIIDQGYETMEGASGDDWISVSQSMRAYLRFSLLGGVIARQIRNLGYKAKAHTVMDGEVLQPPLLLLQSGLGEVQPDRRGDPEPLPRPAPEIGRGHHRHADGPTTSRWISASRPFCESCNKCARECPSGAITAGPKLMFNGYEIWKSDSQKVRHLPDHHTGRGDVRALHEDLPVEPGRLVRGSAVPLGGDEHGPRPRPRWPSWTIAAGKGGLNAVKKWWWDLELDADGGYRPTQHPVN